MKNPKYKLTHGGTIAGDLHPLRVAASTERVHTRLCAAA